MVPWVVVTVASWTTSTVAESSSGSPTAVEQHLAGALHLRGLVALLHRVEDLVVLGLGLGGEQLVDALDVASKSVPSILSIRSANCEATFAAAVRSCSASWSDRAFIPNHTAATMAARKTTASAAVKTRRVRDTYAWAQGAPLHRDLRPRHWFPRSRPTPGCLPATAGGASISRSPRRRAVRHRRHRRSWRWCPGRTRSPCPVGIVRRDR